MADAHDDASAEPVEEEDEEESVAPAPFALCPAQAYNNVLDYTKTAQRKLFDGGVAKLSSELFNCEPDGLFGFLRNLEDRAAEYGWNDADNGIMSIPNYTGVGNDYDGFTDLLTHYGEIPIERVTRFERSYIGAQNRPAQDTMMLYKCLMNSLSSEGKQKINIWARQYKLMVHGTEYPSGNLLLKVIVRESHLDTNASSTFIREKLGALANLMQTSGSDITKFNRSVVLLIESLAARGEISHDLLMNLFRGYAAASDKTFVDYMGRKRERHDEGQNFTWQEIMKLADDKYKQLQQDGKWCAPTPEEEKILALEAKLNKLKSKAAKGSGKPTGKKTTDGKRKTDKNAKGERKREPLPEWMSTKPGKLTMLLPKEYKGKKWWWCSPETGGKCTGHYRVHKPSECRGQEYAKIQAKKRTQDDGQDESSKDKKRKLKITKAMATLATASDTENDE